MQQLVDFEFQWWRDAKGYELVDTPAPEDTAGALIEMWPSHADVLFPLGFPALRGWTDPQPLRPLLPYRIIRLGGDLVPYRPLDIIDDIFRAYINLILEPEAILDFVDRYGPLTRGGLNELAIEPCARNRVQRLGVILAVGLKSESAIPCMDHAAAH